VILQSAGFFRNISEKIEKVLFKKFRLIPKYFGNKIIKFDFALREPENHQPDHSMETFDIIIATRNDESRISRCNSHIIIVAQIQETFETSCHIISHVDRGYTNRI